MATRLLGAKLNLLSVRDVLNARDGDKSDGGGLLLRCAAERAAWVFRYTSTTGKRREMGLGACTRHNSKAAGESLSAARALVDFVNVPPDPIAGWRGDNDFDCPRAPFESEEHLAERAAAEARLRIEPNDCGVIVLCSYCKGQVSQSIADGSCRDTQRANSKDGQ